LNGSFDSGAEVLAISAHRINPLGQNCQHLSTKRSMQIDAGALVCTLPILHGKIQLVRVQKAGNDRHSSICALSCPCLKRGCVKQRSYPCVTRGRCSKNERKSFGERRTHLAEAFICTRSISHLGATARLVSREREGHSFWLPACGH
jgi:hypothetical protein